MKNNFFWLGMLVLVLMLGMTVIGCSNSSGGSTGEKTIIITNIPARLNGWEVELQVYSDATTMVAFGGNIVSGTSITFGLIDAATGKLWTGSGNHLISIDLYDAINGDSEYWVFTNGAAITPQLMANPPKYNIRGSNTISFDLFREI